MSADHAPRGDDAGEGAAGGLRLHVVLGMPPVDYEAALAAGRATPGWQGIDGRAEPRMHAHPALGIIGHAHGQTEEARRPHTHRPVVGWDPRPIFTDEAAPEHHEPTGAKR